MPGSLAAWQLPLGSRGTILQDGGDAFQGARAAAALEAIALVLALTFPDTAAVPDFRAGGSVGKVGTGA